MREALLLIRLRRLQLRLHIWRGRVSLLWFRIYSDYRSALYLASCWLTRRLLARQREYEEWLVREWYGIVAKGQTPSEPPAKLMPAPEGQEIAAGPTAPGDTSGRFATLEFVALDPRRVN